MKGVFYMNKGNVSVDTENIFPIIKKWLYSEKDIFLRELVSNGCDAITKLKKLASMGEAQVNADEKYKIDVILDKENKTITISDNGLGMTEDEVKNYIANVAFSGAEEFAKKYQQDENEDSKIIGHFGLGFYSAFMVSEKVDIKTKSYKEDEKAVLWTCDVEQKLYFIFPMTARNFLKCLFFLKLSKNTAVSSLSKFFSSKAARKLINV